jgi:fructokinase
MFLSIGEVLIDMITDSSSLKNATVFNKYFGGSPANIAINISNQGINSYLLSTVGEDPFGKYIVDFLKSYSVKTDYLSISPKHNTDIVFVNKSKDTPEFKAYRSASLNLNIPENIDLSKFKIMHISSWAVSETKQYENILNLIKIAKKHNIIIGFDPNYRKVLWHNKYSIIEVLKEIGPYVDIIKPSLDDAEHIFGKYGLNNYIKYFNDYNFKNIIFTLGKDGVYVKNNEVEAKIPTYATEVIDVTGAGDAVWSGIYTGLLNKLDIIKSTKVGLAFAAEKLKYTGAIAPIDNWKKLTKKYNI